MKEEAEKLAWLRNAIAAGEADIAAGRTIASEALRKKLALPRRNRAPNGSAERRCARRL
jgi:predicted transcriptional regulator